MNNANELIRPFSDFNKSISENMRKLKEETGKKMIGYDCTYVPVEMILAADMIPVRMLSYPQTITLADASLQSFSCNICRSYLDQLLRGQLQYLDGLVTPKVCDTLQYAHDIQRRHRCVDFDYFLQLPAETSSDASRAWWEQELKLFKEALENFSGNKITDEKLADAIKLMNKIRKTLRDIYRIRVEKTPAIYGYQVLEVILAVMQAPSSDYVLKLEKLRDDLQEMEEISRDKIRLMLIGSTIDFTELELLKEFESSKGIFVTDETCTGMRWIMKDADTSGDPFRSILDSNWYSGFCAAKYPSDIRFDNIKKLAETAKVEGAVIILEKYCDPFGFAVPDTKKLLNNMGIKTLFIEASEVGALGQVKTRAQAFFEMIGGV
ncbi:MAG: 2-hydroxyacyl-CoA dehydratase family protein [Desulfobacterales bacterium]|jgi:benzoyl-CoA reductase subunit C|nr:2-hydroxyacyl-CoA dehydratase family protein [Desulfobacterales bacterium]